MAIDYSTPVGQVRLLIADVNEANLLLSDGQIEALLTVESQVVKRAAAAGLETISRSEVLIAKKISTQDLTTDGPAVAAELRASAKALRDQAQKDLDDVQLGPDVWDISVVDFDPNAPYRRYT